MTHEPGSIPGVDVLVEHQLPRLLQAQLFLVLGGFNQLSQHLNYGGVVWQEQRGGCKSSQRIHLHGLSEILFEQGRLPASTSWINSIVKSPP
jgi:hypothetical protein